MNSLRLICTALALAIVTTATTASAQTWPTRPLRLVVPFAPGGGNDTVARAIGAQISGPLGQTVVIENEAGAPAA